MKTKRLRLTPFLLATALVALTGPAPAIWAAGDVPEGRDFGAGLTMKAALSLEQVVASPQEYEGRPILVEGRISEVCQHKGCWTILQEGDATVRVRFKDYGFFLPTDSSGQQAYVQGLLKVETLDEETAKHYAEDSEHADPEAIRGPQREIGFVATGVRLVPAE